MKPSKPRVMEWAKSTFEPRFEYGDQAQAAHLCDTADGSKLGVFIADVCGHGVAAAFITAMTKITFRNACYSSLDPAVVINQMNMDVELKDRSRKI